MSSLRYCRFDLVPLVAIRQRGRINLYPIELLMVVPNQRVTIPQTTGDMSKVMTKVRTFEL